MHRSPQYFHQTMAGSTRFRYRTIFHLFFSFSHTRNTRTAAPQNLLGWLPICYESGIREQSLLSTLRASIESRFRYSTRTGRGVQKVTWLWSEVVRETKKKLQYSRNCAGCFCCFVLGLRSYPVPHFVRGTLSLTLSKPSLGLKLFWGARIYVILPWKFRHSIGETFAPH